MASFVATEEASHEDLPDCADDLALAEDERALIVRSVQLSDDVEVPDVAVGSTVPGDIELKTLPGPVLSKAGKLTSCRYFVADDRIAVVDPEEDTVVLLIAPE